MTSSPRRAPAGHPALLVAICAAALFAINAYLCHELFGTEITKQTGSIEAAFISFSRWLMDHAGDWRWFPMWVNGIPVRQVYNPALHVTIAELAKIVGWTTPHAYHFVTAAAYCLGPVTLFWLCYRATYNLGLAILAGALYSLISPSVFLFPALRADLGGWLFARRFQTLVVYGEGPHMTDLMMLPLAIWLVDEAVTGRKWFFVLAAPFGLAALVLTNWTGTTGASFAFAAYSLSKFGAEKTGGSRPAHWPTLVGIGVIAYLFASPWVPPSLIRSVQASTAGMDTVASPTSKVLLVLALGLVIAGFHFGFSRYRTQSWARFFVYYALISGLVVGAKTLFGLSLVPIGYRFHLELEMALAGVIAYGAVYAGRRLPRRARIVALCVLAIAGAVQVRNYRRYARRITEPVDFPKTVEYKMAEWFASNMKDQRVFAPGTVSYWMNLYSDVPQFFGCCDQSVRNEEVRIATYVIYSGDGTGDRDGEIATTWLKAYGVHAVGVAATGSSQLGQPYHNPHKFDGLLPEGWRDGESVVYRIPGQTDSLAHVVSRSEIVTAHPVNGVDVGPLLPLVAALERENKKPDGGASLRWINSHEFEITAQTGPDETLFVQETYDPGWRAVESDRELKVVPDALGLMTIEPGAAGRHVIRMQYGSSREDTLARGAHFAGVLLLLGWAVRRWMARDRA